MHFRKGYSEVITGGMGVVEGGVSSWWVCHRGRCRHKLIEGRKEVLGLRDGRWKFCSFFFVCVDFVAGSQIDGFFSCM